MLKSNKQDTHNDFNIVLLNKLEDNNNHIFICGEKHTTGAQTTNALANWLTYIENIKPNCLNSNKKSLILISEPLPSIYNKDNKDVPYDAQHINLCAKENKISTKKQEEYLKLISNGIKIYGAENDDSNPFNKLLIPKKYSLQEIYDQIGYIAKELGLMKEFNPIKRQLQKEYKNNDNDLCENLLISTMALYANSNERIKRLNQQIEKLATNIIKNNENFLIICDTGAAHVSSLYQKSSFFIFKNTLIEDGLLLRFQKKYFQSPISVDACFISDQKQAIKEYTPEETEQSSNFYFSPIKNVLYTSENHLELNNQEINKQLTNKN